MSKIDATLRQVHVARAAFFGNLEWCAFSLRLRLNSILLRMSRMGAYCAKSGKEFFRNGPTISKAHLGGYLDGHGTFGLVWFFRAKDLYDFY